MGQREVGSGKRTDRRRGRRKGKPNTGGGGALEGGEGGGEGKASGRKGSKKGDRGERLRWKGQLRGPPGWGGGTPGGPADRAATRRVHRRALPCGGDRRRGGGRSAGERAEGAGGQVGEGQRLRPAHSEDMAGPQREREGEGCGAEVAARGGEGGGRAAQERAERPGRRGGISRGWGGP